MNDDPKRLNTMMTEMQHDLEMGFDAADISGTGTIGLMT